MVEAMRIARSLNVIRFEVYFHECPGHTLAARWVGARYQEVGASQEDVEEEWAPQVQAQHLVGP